MTTMLDKCAVAGDITQAIDRRGAWTVALTVIGGTENTAVKIQSAPSASGVFTDFKTLISADDADTDQYKGFVVDLHGADKFIKVTGAVMATAVLGDCDHDIKDVTIKAGEVPSGADLEDNKAATIDVSAYTEPVEVSPSDGYDGMKKATVTLSNVPEIEANKAQTIDVSTYTEPVEITPTQGKDGMAKATVTLSNIPSGGSVKLYAWSRFNSEAGEDYYVYTLSTTPSVNDDVYIGLSWQEIRKDYSTVGSYSDNEITVGADTYTRDSEGDLVLQAGEGGGSNTLYAWQDNSNIVYTSTATPTTSNKAVYSDNGLYAQDISEVGEDTITTNFGTLTRYPDGDIQL